MPGMPRGRQERLSERYSSFYGLQYEAAPASIDVLRDAMFAYFGVDSQMGMLPHLYSDFKKDFFAGFAAKVAAAAVAGDALANHVMSLAGTELGKHVAAILPRVRSARYSPCVGVGNTHRLTHFSQVPEASLALGLDIVCVGSVWKSWPLIKDAFLAAVNAHPSRPAYGAFSHLRISPGRQI
jgi:N-acetylglucosamine kinase